MWYFDEQTAELAIRKPLTTTLHARESVNYRSCTIQCIGFYIPHWMKDKSIHQLFLAGTCIIQCTFQSTKESKRDCSYLIINSYYDWKLIWIDRKALNIFFFYSNFFFFFEFLFKYFCTCIKWLVLTLVKACVSTEVWAAGVLLMSENYIN